MIMGRVRRKILVGCVKVERNCCDKGIKQVKRKKILSTCISRARCYFDEL